jgi:hypothetical protein
VLNTIEEQVVANIIEGETIVVYLAPPSQGML